MKIGFSLLMHKNAYFVFVFFYWIVLKHRGCQSAASMF